VAQPYWTVRGIGESWSDISKPFRLENKRSSENVDTSPSIKIEPVIKRCFWFKRKITTFVFTCSARKVRTLYRVVCLSSLGS